MKTEARYHTLWDLSRRAKDLFG